MSADLWRVIEGLAFVDYRSCGRKSIQKAKDARTTKSNGDSAGCMRKKHIDNVHVSKV